MALKCPYCGGKVEYSYATNAYPEDPWVYECDGCEVEFVYHMEYGTHQFAFANRRPDFPERSIEPIEIEEQAA